MDIALFWNGTEHSADIAVAAGDLVMDSDLQTAVLISLFTDRRAEDDDILPDEFSSRRGWWGDALDVNGVQRRIASRLWLLGREKQLTEVVARAKEYAEESLAWLVEDGVATAVTVDARVAAKGVLSLAVRITRPKAGAAKFAFDFAWSNINIVRS
jgi:phage gp46-like protein